MAVSAPEYRFPYYRNHGFLVQEYSGRVLNKNDQYREVVAREKDLFERFRNGLTDAQKGQLDECYSAICDSSAVAEKIAYRCGAKDLVFYLFLDR